MALTAAGGAHDSHRAVVRAVIAVARAITARATAETVKGWRDQHPPTEHARFDLPLVDYWTPRVRAALLADWPHGRLAAAVVTARQVAPLQKAGTADDAWRNFIAGVARNGLRVDLTERGALAGVLRRLYTESWLTGGYVAGRQVGPDAILAEGMADLIAGVDWDNWAPGWVDAAIVADAGGLADLLADASITIRGINDTLMREIGDAIADGLLRGDSVETIGRSLRGLVGDAFRALRIAQTETARAMTRASINTYAANGITSFDWITTSGACPLCLNAEAGNPHSIGDPTPPGHPMCRCAVGPSLRSSPLPGFAGAVTVDLAGDAEITES